MQPVTYTPRIYVVKSVPYIVGVVSSTHAEPHECIFAAMAEAIRFARARRGSVEVDVDGRVVWSSAAQ